MACARVVTLDEGGTLAAAKADGDETVVGVGVIGASRGLLGHTKEIRCMAVHRGLIVSGASFDECRAGGSTRRLLLQLAS